MNILLAILVFSVIIIVHELGHFIVAKINGVMVLEFCIGFGPKLIHFTKGETCYSIKLIPFGGACIMLGEDDALDETANENGNTEDGEAVKVVYDPERSFANKSVWARIAIVVAGPLFNFILAFVFAIIIIGNVGYDPCVVDVVYEGSPGEIAGLQKGDVIDSINGRGINFAREFNLYRNIYPDENLELVYIRNGEKFTTTVQLEHRVKTVYQIGVSVKGGNLITLVHDDTPAKDAGLKINDVVLKVDGREVTQNNTLSDLITAGEGKSVELTVLRDGSEKQISLAPKMVEVEDYYSGFACYGNRVMVSPLETIKYGFGELGYCVRYVFDSLGMLVRGQVGLDDMSGPVGVVSIIGQVVEQSKPDGAFYVFLNMLNMTVLISANLGVMNLLPLPAIDGGRLVFLIIEAVRGKPVSKEKEGMVHMIGMILLMILMFVVMFNDIRKLF